LNPTNEPQIASLGELAASEEDGRRLGNSEREGGVLRFQGNNRNKKDKIGKTKIKKNKKNPSFSFAN